jgi:beta-mannanase
MIFLKRLSGLLLGVLASASGMGQTQLYTSNAAATSVKLNWSYDLSPSGGIYYGAHAPDMNAFTADAGKPVAIWHKYIAWGSSWNSFPASTMTSIRNSGSIPLISWEPWAYNITDANYQLADIINGNYDAYIAAWAENAKAWGYPFFLRFAHEMNGKTWYPWQEGLNGNSSGQYVQAWRHVVDIFRAAGANNVNWVWCPNIKFTGSTSMASLYPGDDYVDWLALDGYNGISLNSSWKAFPQVFDPSLADLNQLSPDKNIMIAEMSCSESGGSKAAWITDALGTQIPARSKIKAFVWFNGIDAYDYTIESSPAATAAFSAAIASPYFLSNQFAALGAPSYEVRYKKAGDNSWIASLTNNYSLDLAGLQPGSQFEFQVRAITPAGYSAYSASEYFNTPELITGITDGAEQAVSYSVYPNPFDGEMNIRVTAAVTSPIEVNVYDTRGALVLSSKDHSTNEKFTIGNVLNSGLYFVNITVEGQKTWMTKMVKTK